MQLKRNFVSIDGKLYEIIRTIREDHNPIIETWKEHLGCEKLFKKDGYYFFVQEVEEAQIETENTENETHKGI